MVLSGIFGSCNSTSKLMIVGRPVSGALLKAKFDSGRCIVAKFKALLHYFKRLTILKICLSLA